MTTTLISLFVSCLMGIVTANIVDCFTTNMFIIASSAAIVSGITMGELMERFDASNNQDV